ncbi:MAG TPA: HEAT repeat domain-containing protein [Ktedonobacteraceae bacterium]
MIQDQYTDTFTHVDNVRLAPRMSARRLLIARGIRHLALGLVFALVLTTLEAALWLANPGGLFGATSLTRTLAAFLLLPARLPVLWLVPLGEIALGSWLAWRLAQPLALLAYLKALAREQEVYRARYTPLQSWSYPYDAPISYAVDDPAPTRPRQQRMLTPLTLIETLLTSNPTHLLLLGASGAGKTLFVHEYLSALAQRRRQLAFSRASIPLYVPLNYYALLLQASDLPDDADFSLLAFLDACDQPGLVHAYPYLKRLFRQGRLLFICDGLDEVPAMYRPALERELIQLLRQTRNSLLLTCTPELYEQSNELARAVGENLVPRATLPPLAETHARSMVERFIAELDTSFHPNLPTAGQVMSAFEQTRLRLICTTPFYLFALLACIDTLSINEVRQLDTRGRLLRAFLLKRLDATGQSSVADLTVSDDLLFLRELACVVRGKGDSDLLNLPIESIQALNLSEASVNNERGLQQTLVAWARGQQVYFPFAENTVSSLAEALPRDQAGALLQRTYRAGLIDIDGQGVLSFRHSLIVSALLAEYLAGFLGSTHLRLDEIEMLPDDLVLWSEPLALWAGLLPTPLDASEALAVYARQHRGQRIRALVSSLICLGVAQTPPDVDLQEPLQVPPTLDLALREILGDQRALTELARLFEDCAAQGTPELYQALFPLLLIEDSEIFIQCLDPLAISELFFQRLVAIIDDSQQDLLVKRLVRALSCWGKAIVARTAWLCSARSGNSGRLRTAAINILGGTQAREAVEPLMDCLYDSEVYIVKRASNALLRLGADLSLPRLLQELELRAGSSSQRPRHELILPILERFLNEANPARQLRPEQFEQINEALMALMNTQANLADLEKARELLVSQGRLAEERDSGKIALRMLVQNLSTHDDTVARSMTGALKEVGQAATPSLLEQLEEQSSEAERVRILEVLASLRDKRALPALLRLLADSSPAVQHTLAATLGLYAPACIPGLIEVILRHSNELVAGRAEQILGDLGLVVVEPVLRALTPLVEGRTLLLVSVLARVGDQRIVPALVALLRAAQEDVALTLGIIQALGQLADERAIRPLMGLLASTNPLLYEGAINALSNLGELACAELLLGLDTSEKTLLVTRIERTLLGIQPFPGELLLRAVDESNADQVGYIEEVFLMGGIDAAQVLAGHLFHAQPGIRAWVRHVMEHVDGRYAVPALLEILHQPDPASRDLLATYLLKLAPDSVTPLVSLLDDPERGEAAMEILLRAGQPVLPALIPALDSPQSPAQARATYLLLTMIQRQNELINDAVQLFSLPLPAQARTMLVQVLTEELAELSLPALLAGLEDAHLVPEVAAILVHLARQDPSRGALVLDELLLALRSSQRHHGAAVTLIDLGALAVAGAGALIIDDDAQVAHMARQILGEIGTPAFPFLWATYSDASHPERREAAREVFRAMPTLVIKDELVELLTSARQEDISMALALLLERIHDETLQPGRAGEMLPALLEHVQSSTDEQANLRILALLLLLGGSMVASPLVDALYGNPTGHKHLVQAFLLLGQGVEADLRAILKDSNAPIQLQAEAAGILAMRGGDQDIEDLALNLSDHGLWAGRSVHHATKILQASRLNISLRALGGLLVSGHWESTMLQDMRALSKSGSAHRELIEVLLGWRYSPEITSLQQDLENMRKEHSREITAYTQEMLLMKRQSIDLEHDLEILRQEHEEQHRGHEEKSKELQENIGDLTKSKQQLQTAITQASQEKQALAGNMQQALKEKEYYQAEARRWQSYSEQLEKGIEALRRPGSGSGSGSGSNSGF